MNAQLLFADTQILGFNPGDFIALSLIITAFLLLVILSAVRYFRDKIRKKQSEQQYRKQFVKKVYLADPLLGTIEGDYDVPNLTFTAENADLPEFGTKKPSTITAEGFEERDDGIVLRSISLAYSRAPEILEKLAKIVRQEMQFDNSDAETIPAVSEIAEQITMTEFHFTFTEEARIMQLIGGVEIDFKTFGVNALYRIDDEQWDYDAERIGD